MLGQEFSGRRFALVDTMRAIYVIDPGTAKLTAVIAFSGTGHSIVYLGAMWGQLTNEGGQRIQAPDPIEHLRKSRVPMEFSPGDLRFEFNINHHMRECFTTDCQSAFRRGSEEHNIAMKFAVPSGDFVNAQVMFTSRDGRGGSGGGSFGVRGFPLVFPYLNPTSAAPESSPINDSSAVFGPGIEIGWGEISSPQAETPPQEHQQGAKRKLRLRGSRSEGGPASPPVAPSRPEFAASPEEPMSAPQADEVQKPKARLKLRGSKSAPPQQQDFEHAAEETPAQPESAPAARESNDAPVRRKLKLRKN